MRTRYRIAIAGGALLVSFATGRYSGSVKIKTETKTTENKHEVQNVNSDQDKHKETTTTEVIKPDGTKEIVIKTVEDTQKKVDSNDTTQTNSTKDETKTVTKGGSKVNFGLLAGASILSGNPDIGGYANVSVLGPISVGVFGLSSGVIGCSVGLSF